MANPEPGRPSESTRPDPARHDGLDQRFDGDGLVSLRSAVAAHGDRLGLTGDRLSDLLLVAHELASNAVIHGGGGGRLRMWGERGAVRCRVEDTGAGFASTVSDAGWRRPAVGASNGRGLWLVRQLSDDVAIQTGDGGTVVTIVLAL